MRLATMISFVLLCCAPSVAYSQEIHEMRSTRLRESRPIPTIEVPPPEGSSPISPPSPKMKVICKVGSDEVATGPLNGNLLTGKDYDGPDTVRVGSQGQNKKLWGNMSRQKDDHNCPAVMGLMGPGIASLMGGNQVSELFCISARGIVSVQFSSTRVGDCKICDTAGNCHAP